MFKLGQLKPKFGSKFKRTRVGRGTGSGLGKTAGRGHKGQKSRAGGTKGAYFEGGQTPLYRRLPKRRGFKNIPFKTEYAIVNLSTLNRFDGEVGPAEFIKAGLAKSGQLIKVLGEGELKKKLKVSADKFSASAKAKISKAGGEIVEHI